MSSRSAKLLPLGLFLTVIAAAFSFAFTPLRASQDEWWHLKTGLWIIENRRLPVNDIFTYTGENMPWHNHEWLAQMIFYAVYEWGGRRAIGAVRALIVFKALIFAAAIAVLALLARMRCGAWAPALLTAVLAAEISRRTIYPRPPIFSYLLFAVFLFALSAWKMRLLRGRWLWALAPLMVVWANLHGMCLLGIFATGAFAAGEFVETVRNSEFSIKNWTKPSFIRRMLSPSFLFLAGLTLALIVCAMANPAGWRMFFLGRNFTGDPLLRFVIAEMQPPPFPLQRVDFRNGTWGLVFVPGFATFWVTAAAFVILLGWNRFRLAFAADYFIAGFFLYQAASHWRLLPLFALAVAGPLAWLITERLRMLSARALRSAHFGLGGLAALLAFLYVFTVGEPPPHTFFRRNLQLWRGGVMNHTEYPSELMDFIIRARLPDRMFSEINYCGYTMWRLSPEHHKLFTDNRFDVFGSRFYGEAETIASGLERGDSIAAIHTVRENWRELLDRYGINFIVISAEAPLNQKLRAQGGWKRICYTSPPSASGIIPLEGFHVYLRDDPRFAGAAARALELFQQQHPLWPAPGQLDKMRTSPF
ncbi:MAG: hypothetical protein NTY46_07525 [Candidatus Sumerlaeota bacterium]|nr:hypothetical protein [Candidatus Sumerlaeota bacterium]